MTANHRKYVGGRSLICLALCLVFPPRLSAGPPSDMPAPCLTGSVSTVISGDRLILDGKAVQLLDIKAPEYHEPDTAYPTWPHGAQSRAALADITSGKTVTALCHEKALLPDGTPVVSLFTEDHTGNTVHIQQFLIKSGHAFVWPSSRNQAQLAVLYRLEEEARLQKKGLWASEHYHPRQVPDDFLQAGRFMLVHGTVQSSQTVKATHYLNFGADWRKDFTAELPRRIWQDIPDGESFAGKRIEVRGWVDLRGGPRILVRNPYQIRLLNQPANIEAKPD